MKDLQLMEKLETLPGNLRAEVADFIDFLIVKHEGKNVKNREKPKIKKIQQPAFTYETSDAEALKAFVY